MRNRYKGTSYGGTWLKRFKVKVKGYGKEKTKEEYTNMQS